MTNASKVVVACYWGFALALAVLAVWAWTRPVTVTPQAETDGRTPETAAPAGPGTSLPTVTLMVPSRPIPRAVLWWNTKIDARHGRCYVSLDLPTLQRTAYVSVPDDWCEGMR